MDTDKTQADLAKADDSRTDADDPVEAGAEEAAASEAPREFNGPKGPEPTRYGDWEQKGRCSDF